MASQPPPPQDTAPRPQVKQLPPKKEKMQCLHCTKPARITCHHKLCKKCCNERHPNDCKAHDSGPVFDKDKAKPTRVQALQTAQSYAAYPKSDAKSALPRAESSQHDHHAVRAAPPGPHATNLAEAVQTHRQEAQESARWQAYAHSQSQQQQSTEAEQALQHYTDAAELLRQLFQADTALSAEPHSDHEPLQMQGCDGHDEPAPKRVCQEDNTEVQAQDIPVTHGNLVEEKSVEEAAGAVHGDMYNKLTSLQAALGVPSNRTSIVL